MPRRNFAGILNRYSQGSVPFFDEVFRDKEWISINKQQLQECDRVFRTDPNVRTGFTFRMDAILNGGMVFKRGGVFMTGPAQTYNESIYSQVSSDVLAHRWKAGFVAFTFEGDEMFAGKPVTLDLTKVDVKKKKTSIGPPQFKYFLQPETGGGANPIEITNVMTFCWDPPDDYGNLTCMMLQLVGDHAYENLLTYYSMVAIKGRALPAMITEKDRETYDPNNIRVPTARSASEMAEMKNSVENDVEHPATAASSIVLHSHTLAQQVHPSLAPYLLQNVDSLQRVPFFGAHYQLAQGRRFQAAPMPEGPEDTLLKFRVARQERAFALMGVPLAMVSNSTSTGGRKMQEGENSNAFILFDNSQQALKLQLIHVCTALLEHIYMMTNLTDYLRDTPAQKWNIDDAVAMTKMEVEIPSIPDEKKIMLYYTNGWLTYEALIRFLSTRNGIAIDNWEKKPALTVLEANGIKPDDGPVAKKAKKG